MGLTPEIKAVRTIDAIVDVLVFTLLILLLVIGGYCMWDNKNIENAASSAEWAVYKPTHDGIESFQELMKLNPDVIGWLDVYGTPIDYPVLYSKVPDEYLMKDPRGNFSLTGSIFMDSECAPDFSDLQTIIYGHHMDRRIMFGPIDDFEKKDFFDEHRYGKLTFKDGTEKGLDIWVLISGDAYDHKLYRRGIKDLGEEAEYLKYLSTLAIQTRDEVRILPEEQILLMSTCAGETTNGRKLLVAKITDDVPENPFLKDPNYGDGTGLDAWSLFGIPWYVWGLILLVILIILFVVYTRYMRERREKKKKVLERKADLIDKENKSDADKKSKEDLLYKKKKE